MVEDPKQKTIEYYDRNAEKWAGDRPDRGSFWADETEKFHKLLPKGRILEIGSGSGHDTQNLIALGYDYVGTDASEELLKIAGKRNPGAKFYKKTVQELDDSLGKFDGFWAVAVLLHIPKKEINSALQSIKDRLNSGGIGFITLKEGEGEAADETGRLFAYYQSDEFSKILDKNGFDILESARRKGDRNTWLEFFVKSR